ncbi:thiamin pyrophosphokinase 1 [Culicoides brevitarsis]|uniref:thiamin pyrophosphokinase 1 n=1 Tax=Culicoides brevitarsis TaxID=469753 RepID=UPI00307C3484
MHKEWYPQKYLTNDDSENYAIMILNRPISLSFFTKLWNDATIRFCVDGGLDQFLSYKKSCTHLLKNPYIITGDFDSCSSESMEFAKLKKCKIIQTPDQNETDFTKALRTLETEIQNTKTNFILVICETSGRLDQIMANVNTLFKAMNFMKTEIVLLSSNSLSFLLAPGFHTIHIPQFIVKAQYWCALVPFKRSVVRTKGLKWNLTDTVMEFGGMVSTSNTYEKDTKTVEVTTDSALLWIMGLSN